jgi:hypothetical protein
VVLAALSLVVGIAACYFGRPVLPVPLFLFAMTLMMMERQKSP